MVDLSHPKLSGFDIIQTNYKYVGDHGIRADILIPQTEYARARPLLVRIHGGGLIMGDSLYLDWWPHWVFDLARQKNAIIISPNYRLLPEATSADIYADMEDFWTWLRSPDLANLLANHTVRTSLDLDRIFVTGESAGGLLGLYLALAHADEIRAASSDYPGLALNEDSFTKARANPPFGQDVPESLVQETLRSVKLGTPESSITSSERLPFMLGAIQHGYLSKFYQRDAEDVPPQVLYPIARLESPDVKIPRGGIVVIHGRQDSVVPLIDVEKFVERAQQVLKDQSSESEGVTLVVRDGEHGFDSDMRLEEAWLRDALRKAIDVWSE